MTTVTLAEAKAKLEELVDHLVPGETIVIVKDDKPVAQLSPPPGVAGASQFGFWQGKLEIVSDDEEHLADFKEYMP
jgi:antitoxin (DNA-binding transcriptional repressor) of toxin-antitoxin stability system